MAFRKRNVVISQKGDAPSNAVPNQAIPGARPSPVTGHATTSTGTESLDKLLGLGAGLAMGTSILIEEEGTTEFSRSLLSCYGAEGVLQGHAVFVVGPEGSLTLPGLVEKTSKKSIEKSSLESDRMKIAWRYERLGAFEDRERGLQRDAELPAQQLEMVPFCHSFDLTKRLAIPAGKRRPSYVSPAITAGNDSPFAPIMSALSTHLSSGSSEPTRLIIPSLLSPLIYPAVASQPSHLITFLHGIRTLLRRHALLTVAMTWPLALYPMTDPLTRWSRMMSDGVITLRPFPHSFSVDAIDLGSDPQGKIEEKMQGLISVRKLPVLTEKGISVGLGEDMAFAVGRKRFVVRPFHLPPLEAEEEGKGGANEKAPDAKSLEF